MKSRRFSPEQKKFSKPCTQCGLYARCEAGKMSGELQGKPDPDDPLIIFVGEAPGGMEDEFNRPFIGKAGQKLRDALKSLNIPEEWCFFTNAVRCRPTNNRTPTDKELNYCFPFLEEELEKLQPDVIVTLGNVPTKLLLDKDGITKLNGIEHNWENIPVIPAYHPSYIMRGVRDDTVLDWLDALDLAAQIAENDIHDDTDKQKDLREEWEVITPRKLEDIDQKLQELSEGAIKSGHSFIAYDIETRWLPPEDQNNCITVVSFAVDGKAVSFPIDHNESWWSKEEREKLLEIMDYYLNDELGIIGHNTRFDQKHTYYKLEIDFEPAGDTLHLARTLYAHEKSNSLNVLSNRLLGITNLKTPIDDYKAEHSEADPKKGGDFGLVPLELLLPYCAYDTLVTWDCHKIMYEQLTNQQRILYHQLLQPASYVLGHMEMNGIMTDPEVSKRYMWVYENVIKECLRKLERDPAVQYLINLKQEEQDAIWAEKFGLTLDEVDEYMDSYAEVTFEETVNEIKNKNSRAKRKFFKFNPNSTHQMREVIYGLKKFEPLGFTKTTGEPSTSWDYVKNYVDDDPEFFTAYRNYVLYSDMVSKYIKPIADKKWLYGEDDRLRSGFNLSLAKTGRLSSSNPTNLQNWPSNEKEYGKLPYYLPPKNGLCASYWSNDRSDKWDNGGSYPIAYIPNTKSGKLRIKYTRGELVIADYSSAELRVFASIANIAGMLQTFEEDRDPHAFVTRMVFDDKMPKELIDNVTKETDKIIKHKFGHLRYRAKWVNWTEIFGGDWYTLHKTYMLTKEEAKDIESRYLLAFPEIPKFHNKIEKFVLNNGYVESVLGRRLQLPHLNHIEKKKNSGYYRKDLRTALDFPIQGPASDLLLMSLIILHDKIQQYGMRSILVNTVHDSIMGDCPKGEIEMMSNLYYKVMPNLPTLKKEYFPDIPLDWLKVRMKCDVDTITYYGDE